MSDMRIGENQSNPIKEPDQENTSPLTALKEKVQTTVKIPLNEKPTNVHVYTKPDLQAQLKDRIELAFKEKHLQAKV